MKKIILPIITLAVLLTSCTGGTDPENSGGRKEFEPIMLSAQEKAIVGNQNIFAFDFYKKAMAYNDINSNDNFIASPLSLSVVMSMLANGAEGQTRNELLSVLGFEDDDLDAVNTFNNKLIKELALADAKTNLSIANSMWIDNRLNVKEGFINDNKAAYDAEIFVRELSSEETKNEINRWALDKTHGLIPQLLDSPLERSVLMSLINALYFKSEWASPFEKENTKPAPFYNADGTIGSIDMMSDMSRDFLVKRDETNKTLWCKLRYGNGAYSLVLFMPEESTVGEYLEKLSEEDFLDCVKATFWMAKSGELKFPKFESETMMGLKSICRTLGIEKIFEREAEFSPITEELFFVSEILQKSKIIFNEKGTEAASVTVLTGDGMNFSGVDSDSIIFDHPFGYLIMEESTNAILFTGRVNKF